jgi:peptidoglycan/xylan/chitin deacetylase (PgdA/CDA1 family)
MGKTSGCVRFGRKAALAVGILAGLAVQSASAADCPGHPDALGTSRTLVVDPREHRLIGTMQYRETLPLADHEVVLTFDDGPLPHNSNQVLDILAAECIKATFFTIGQQARSSPEGVRKLLAAGHTIGTHTQNHPLNMDRMPIERAKQQIDDGIASTKAALGDNADQLAPFFRIPGLMRADRVENYLAEKGIQIWSADFPADDWRHISSSRVYELAISRLEAKGKGILLLHDIQARTVAALPHIIETLKARGYRIVHVVPATADRPATPTEKQQWLLHPPLDAVARWPQVPNFVFARLGSLPVPARSVFTAATDAFRLRETFLSYVAWPEAPTISQNETAAVLASPAATLFAVQGNLDVALKNAARISHRAQRLASAASRPNTERMSRRQLRGLATERSKRSGSGYDGLQSGGVTARAAKSKSQMRVTAHRGPVKRPVQVRKRRA